MLEMSIIIALAMSLTPIISEYIHIPKKLRAWTTLLLIIGLNIGNSYLFGDQQIVESVRQSIIQGIVAVGIYSGSKNTMEYVMTKKEDNDESKNKSK